MAIGVLGMAKWAVFAYNRAVEKPEERILITADNVRPFIKVKGQEVYIGEILVSCGRQKDVRPCKITGKYPVTVKRDGIYAGNDLVDKRIFV